MDIELAILIAAIIVILAIVIVLAVLIAMQAKKRRNRFVSYEEQNYNGNVYNQPPYGGYQPPYSDGGYNNGRTEMIIPKGGGNKTQSIWGGNSGVQILLRDVNSPMVTFQSSIADSLIIGRNPDVCSIVIDYDGSVSGEHCQLFLSGKRVMVRDLNSSNGTFFNNTRVMSEIEIFSGGILRLGRIELSVEIS